MRGQSDTEMSLSVSILPGVWAISPTAKVGRDMGGVVFYPSVTRLAHGVGAGAGTWRGSLLGPPAVAAEFFPEPATARRGIMDIFNGESFARRVIILYGLLGRKVSVCIPSRLPFKVAFFFHGYANGGFFSVENDGDVLANPWGVRIFLSFRPRGQAARGYGPPVITLSNVVVLSGDLI